MVKLVKLYIIHVCYYVSNFICCFSLYHLLILNFIYNSLIDGIYSRLINNAKRRKSDDISISSLLNWDLCLYCQSQTKENLRCPGSLVKEKHDPKVVYEKIAKNIREFEKIDALPIDLYLDEGNDNLGKLFKENSAKFHKSCTNIFSDMKLERALKRVKKAANDKNNDQQGSDEDETQSSNG